MTFRRGASANQPIEVLHGLEVVRRRPEMFLGAGDRAAETFLSFLVGHAVEQHVARRARTLSIDLDRSGLVTVEDDGPGISTRRMPGGRTFFERALSTLMAGATFHDQVPYQHPAAGWWGAGLSVVNAVSSRFEIDVWHRGEHWAARFARGVAVERPRRVGPATRSGTRIRCRPDRQIIPRGPDRSTIEARLRQLAWLTPGLCVRWHRDVLPWQGGVAGLVAEMRGDSGGATPIVETRRVTDDLALDLALGWSQRATCDVRGFVNHACCDAGTHVEGLLSGVGATNRLAGRRPRSADGAARGLCAVVHVMLHDVQYAEPARRTLSTARVAAATEDAVRSAVAHARSRHPELDALLDARSPIGPTGRRSGRTRGGD